MATKKVSVLGAGITGIAVSNALKSRELQVTLIDRNPYPGGRAVWYGCKAVENCVQCGVCLVREQMERLQDSFFSGSGEVVQAPRLLLSGEVAGLVRNPDGHLDIRIDRSANMIDPEKCIECGRCADACATNSIRKVEGWRFYVEESCSSCGECVEICPTGAISHEPPKPITELISADAVVVATGSEAFDPVVNRKWGMGNKRVITGTELEHLFYEQAYLPPETNNIAFVQCVGSRSSTEGVEGCSRVCCPYALRMASRLGADYPDTQIDFFHIDIQRFGTDFEVFWGLAKERVNLIRSNPIAVETDAEGRPVVRYEDPNSHSCIENSYDLVVLSHGMVPGEDTEQVADLFNLGRGSEGYFGDLVTDSSFDRVDGLLPGIFTAGCCKGPLRINECIEDAEAISGRVRSYLGELN